MNVNMTCKSCANHKPFQSNEMVVYCGYNDTAEPILAPHPKFGILVRVMANHCHDFMPIGAQYSHLRKREVAPLTIQELQAAVNKRRIG